MVYRDDYLYSGDLCLVVEVTKHTNKIFIMPRNVGIMKSNVFYFDLEVQAPFLPRNFRHLEHKKLYLLFGLSMISHAATELFTSIQY